MTTYIITRSGSTETVATIDHETPRVEVRKIGDNYANHYGIAFDVWRLTTDPMTGTVHRDFHYWAHPAASIDRYTDAECWGFADASEDIWSADAE